MRRTMRKWLLHVLARWPSSSIYSAPIRAFAKVPGGMMSPNGGNFGISLIRSKPKSISALVDASET
jgi:hypothetical protein